MDISVVITEIERAIGGQLRLAGDDPDLEQAAEALLAALQPALRQAAIMLAEQAAAEMDAQLPEHEISVVLTAGEPGLLVRSTAESVAVSPEDLEARLTVRLPRALKGDLEVAAGELGDSVNTYVIKTLASKTRAVDHKAGRRFKGTIQT